MRIQVDCVPAVDRKLADVEIHGHPCYDGVIREDAILIIPVPKELESLALSKDGDDWDSMCNKLESFGFLNPIGNMHVTHLMVNGKRRIFH